MDENSPTKVRFTMAGIADGLTRLGPVGLFVVPFGMAFGVAALGAGFSVGQAIAMSATVFSGAAQFASLEFARDSVPSVALLLAVAAVSARHILMGAALSPWINQLGRPRRLFALSLLSDANFADCHGAFQQDERDIGRLVGGGLALWIAWVVGTAIGSVAGASLSSLERFGIDVLMVVYFTALVVGQPDWRQRRWRRVLVPSAVAAIAAIAGLWILPVGWNVVLAALAGGVAGVLTDGR